LKKISSILLKVSITLALLIFLFKKTDFKSLLGVAHQSDLSLMGLAFLLFVFLNILVGVRWYLLLKGQAVNVGFLRLFLSYLASLFFNLVLPSTIGGDAVRTLDISHHSGSHSSNILATVVLDRVSGFFGLMTVLFLALVLDFRVLHDPAILSVTFILFGLVFFLIGIMFSRRFFDFLFLHLPFQKFKAYLYKIHEATSGYRDKKTILAGVWFLSVLVQGGMSFVFYCMARAIGLKLGLIPFLVFVPVITAFSVLPISIGGLGLRDTACVVLFAKVGVAAEKALCMSLANFGFMFVLGVLGGLSYVFTLHHRRV
jgi:uncharacterized protein (TIRG00374 family)